MVLRLENIGKRYARGGVVVDALAAATVTLQAGDFMVVHGPSGSGKSTMLLIAGGMLKPGTGRVLVDDTDLYASRSGCISRYRRRNVGFVFQRLHLIDYLSVRDNLRFALAMRGCGPDKAQTLEQTAEKLGIHERLDHLPCELSIGEQQRAAVARALVGGPKVVLADEPTGNLDPQNARIIAGVLADFARKGNVVVMVTHNHDLLHTGSRLMGIRAGHMSPDARNAVERVSP
jgi:putative ABC transport system ATP-binding protein